MLIEENKLKFWIDNFYGYGSWAAKFWFIGYEENGGDTPDEVAEKINYFKDTFNPAGDAKLCDLRDLYRNVAFRSNGPNTRSFKSLYEYRFGANAVVHGTWKNLIAFEYGFRNQPLPDLAEYQKTSFTNVDNHEALLQLYPLPAHNHAWYYSWLELKQLSFLKVRAEYEEHVFPGRMKRILDNISAYKPEVIVMYGMENIAKIKEYVQAAFPKTKFKMVKAIKREIPQHHRADLGGTILLLTTQIPALHHNRVETGFDWYALGQLVRQGSNV